MLPISFPFFINNPLLQLHPSTYLHVYYECVYRGVALLQLPSAYLAHCVFPPKPVSQVGGEGERGGGSTDSTYFCGGIVIPRVSDHLLLGYK